MRVRISLNIGEPLFFETVFGTKQCETVAIQIPLGFALDSKWTTLYNSRDELFWDHNNYQIADGENFISMGCKRDENVFRKEVFFCSAFVECFSSFLISYRAFVAAVVFGEWEIGSRFYSELQ